MKISPHTQLAQLIEKADAIERSWSLSQGHVEDRILLYFDANRETALELAQLSVDLNISRDMLAAWSKALPLADAIGIAVNRDFSSVRLYTQYWHAIASQVALGDTAPAMLYAGFKSLPNGLTRIDKYICHPMAPTSTFLPPLQETLAALGADVSGFDSAFAGLSAETAIFTTIDAADRRSWLTTLRRAGLDRAKIAEILAPLGAPVAQAAQDYDLLHVAAGEDAAKGRFTTLYFAIPAAAALSFLG